MPLVRKCPNKSLLSRNYATTYKCHLYTDTQLKVYFRALPSNDVKYIFTYVVTCSCIKPHLTGFLVGHA